MLTELLGSAEFLASIEIPRGETVLVGKVFASVRGRFDGESKSNRS